ncbi:hypothetical protein ACSFXN_03055 [Planococcus sp. 1R117A]|uniref:hypothetical protein n=1 Tax=Planococcus sp. 1R117A TaxID=3447020 RepID=UPI003EDBBCA9
MVKKLVPLMLILCLAACGGNAELTEEGETEVTAPEGELDPTAPEAVDEAKPTTFTALRDGEVAEGTAVILSGEVEELTDDGAFPAFILTDGENQVFIRNMAETLVEAGDSVAVHGIYDGVAEEELPLISASVIETE